MYDVDGSSAIAGWGTLFMTLVNTRVPLTFLDGYLVTGRTWSEDVVIVQHTLPRDGEVTLYKW